MRILAPLTVKAKRDPVVLHCVVIALNRIAREQGYVSAGALFQGVKDLAAADAKAREFGYESLADVMAALDVEEAE